MAWTDSIPAVANKISVSIPAIEGNFAWLKTLLTRDYKDWDDPDIGKNACYWPDSAEDDQGVTATGDGSTIYDLVTNIGSTKYAIIYLRHDAEAADNTTYKFKTSLNIPYNICLMPEHGALIDTDYSVCDGGSEWTWALHSGSIYKLNETISTPSKLYENGTELTEVTDIASIDAASKWCWYGNTIYVWTSGSVDPDSLASGTLVAAVTLGIYGPFPVDKVKVFPSYGVIYLSCREIYPEWWGALADSATDSGSAIQAALDSAGAGSKIILSSNDTSYYLVEDVTLTIDDATSRKLTVEGYGIAYIQSKMTTTAFKVMSRNTILRRIYLIAHSTVVRDNASQIGLLITNVTGCVFDQCSIQDFYIAVDMYAEEDGQEPIYIETCEFHKIYIEDPMIGWNLHTSKVGWKSFATNMWYGCNVSIDSALTGAIGVKIGQYLDLYRSYMDINVHNKSADSYGFYFDGSTSGMTGRWTVECHSKATGITSHTGIYMGPNSTGLQGEIFTHIMQCGNPYDRHTSGCRPTGLYRESKEGRVTITWSSIEKSYVTWETAGYFTSKTITDATAGATTNLEVVDHGMEAGDIVTIGTIATGNPFESILEWNNFDIISVPGVDNIIIDVDTSSVTDAWTSTAGIKAGYRQFAIKNSGATNYLHFLTRKRFSFKCTQDDEDFQFVGMIPYLSTTEVSGATPSVAGCPAITLANTVATDVTDFLDGVVANRLLVVIHDTSSGVSTLKHATGKINTQDGLDCIGTNHMIHLFIYENTTWRELARFTP